MPKVNDVRNSPEWSWIPLASVKPYHKEVRRHDRSKINKLKKLIGHFGQVAPIIIDGNNVVIDGHAVWHAMRELGSGEIAAVVVAGRTDPEIKALRLALNRVVADAAWDNVQLRVEFEELVSLSFDLELTGFHAVEIDHILELDLPKLNVGEDLDQIPPLQPSAVTVAGDIWSCGRHRLGCGDARDQTFVDKVRNGASALICFIDPPYNVPIAGFVSGKGRAQHREFLHASGEMTAEEFTAFLAEALAVLRQSASDSTVIYACMDWRHLLELLTAGQHCHLPLLNICVWAKTNGGMGSLYRNQHELICVFKAGAGQHANNVELGRHGRNRSNLWTYRGLNAFGKDRDELLAAHPTVKPVQLIADAIRDVTTRGDAVLDTFMGSGSTLMAAEETGRLCLGTELDPLYVDVAVRRWQNQTRQDAVHAETGELFNERALRLASENEEVRHG